MSANSNASHHAAGHHDDHNDISHVASKKILLGTGGALMFLTIITVAATKIDLGSSTNLLIAMLIALVKATLVVLFFMHLVYDRVFHSVLLVLGLAAAALFVAFALMDSNQYQDTVRWDQYKAIPAPVGPQFPQ